MGKYTARQFRDNLAKALDSVDRGELVIIERHAHNYGKGNSLASGKGKKKDVGERPKKSYSVKKYEADDRG